MLRILGIVAVFWIAILPPFFTNGACSAEFDNASARIDREKRSPSGHLPLPWVGRTLDWAS